MKISIHFFALIILLGGVIGSLAVGPTAILNACQKETEQYEKRYDYEGHWAQTYIEKAIVGGFVNGYPDGSFKPDEPVSRAGFAAILYKAVKEPNIEITLTDLKDYDEVPQWAKAGIEKAISLNWLQVYEDNTIRPMEPVYWRDINKLLPVGELPSETVKTKQDQAVTRAEACVIVLNIKE